ncbi:uncharacterized protein LOC135488466 isoform X2 [Lineus longissimus]|uniref:uncharacterized protein LOC135488466 isoform X2 n=1 Tax=Lineus longissimus TaxID=88925 RepID=UPI00315CCB62
MIQAAPASRPEATSQPVNNRKSVKAKKRKASKGKASKAKGDYCAAERIDNYDPKNNTYYIKWQGYDASHNSWVKAEDVTSPLISSYKEKLERFLFNKNTSLVRKLLGTLQSSGSLWFKGISNQYEVAA